MLEVHRDLLHVLSLANTLTFLESPLLQCQVDDAVNRGIPSIVDLEVQWHVRALVADRHTHMLPRG